MDDSASEESVIMSDILVTHQNGSNDVAWVFTGPDLDLDVVRQNLIRPTIEEDGLKPLRENEDMTG